jgi:uncharacterized membrane protein
VSGNLRTALAADVGALVYLALSFRIMLACGRDMMRKAAREAGRQRCLILVLVLVERSP